MKPSAIRRVTIAAPPVSHKSSPGVRSVSVRSIGGWERGAGASSSAVSSIAATVSGAAGNVSLLSNVVTVRIDKTPPDLHPVLSPNPPLLRGPRP